MIRAGCPDCEEEYLRVSFDWAQLSLLMDGGSTDRPKGDCQDSVKIQSERRPQRETRTPRGPYWQLSAPSTAAGVLSQKPAALRLGEGLAPVVWGLSLAPGTDPFSSPHSPTPSP